ncbi:MAG: hypothetical protein ACXIU7_03970 [Roseinatronobacter sp.]
MPNPIAYLALLLWPIVIMWLFRKMPPERAFIWSILGGYMWLPELTSFNLPLVPGLDKSSIPNLTALAVCVMVLKMRFSLLCDGWLAKILTAFLLLAPVASVLVNSDPLEFGYVMSGQMRIVLEPVEPIPGMRIYDSVGSLVRALILALPFFMARQMLATEAALTEFLRILVVAGLIYSVPMLFEVRFSPQLHTWIYGFFQHSFGQMMREGGFRPIVFMPHGLWVAFFALICALSAAHFAREATPEARTRAVLIAIYLAFVLWMCRSMGPRMMFLTLAPLILFCSAKLHLRLAAIMAVVAMLYPLLRGAGLVPTDAWVEFIRSINIERSLSLAFRFDNEDLLLARASEQLLLGWGGWGRNMIRDQMTGEMITITDGMWIIVIGQFGWMGYLGTFGLLCLPIFSLFIAYRRTAAAEVPRVVGVCALLLGANLVDLLPNATLVPLTWLLAGALLGHAELQHAKVRRILPRDLRDLPRDGLLNTAQLHRISEDRFQDAKP